MREITAVALVACAVATAAAAAGCGGGGGPSNDPKSVAQAFVDALKHNDYGKACSLMTSEAKAQLQPIGGKGGSCEDALSAVMSYADAADRDRLEHAKVVSVTVSGGNATVRYSQDKQPTYLVDKGGHWLIAADPSNSDGGRPDADSNAKSDARNMVSQVESCFTDSEDYAKCQTAAALGDTGLNIGSGQGQVEVTKATATTYQVVARSKTGDAFTITKRGDGTLARTCTSPGGGACQPGGTW